MRARLEKAVRMPVMKVLVDFDNKGFGSVDSWTDITDFVTEVSASKQKEGEVLGGVSSDIVTFTVDNSTNAFSPNNPNSFYYKKQKSNIRFVLKAGFQNEELADYMVGYIQTLKPTWKGKTYTLNATCPMEKLKKAKVPTSSYKNVSWNYLVNVLLEQAGIEKNHFQINVPKTEINYSYFKFEEEKCFDAMKKLMEVVCGVAYFDGFKFNVETQLALDYYKNKEHKHELLADDFFEFDEEIDDGVVLNKVDVTAEPKEVCGLEVVVKTPDNMTSVDNETTTYDGSGYVYVKNLPLYYDDSTEITIENLTRGGEVTWELWNAEAGRVKLDSLGLSNVLKGDSLSVNYTYQSLVLLPNQTREYVLQSEEEVDQYLDPDVVAWNPDVTANIPFSTTPDKSGTVSRQYQRIDDEGNVTIALKNNTNNKISISTLQFRGYPVRVKNPIEVHIKDAPSIELYDEKEASIHNNYINNIGHAEKLAQFIVDTKADIPKTLNVDVSGYAELMLSDICLVTEEQSFTNHLMEIHQVDSTFSASGGWVTKLTLIEVPEGDWTYKGFGGESAVIKPPKTIYESFHKGPEPPSDLTLIWFNTNDKVFYVWDEGTKTWVASTAEYDVNVDDIEGFDEALENAKNEINTKVEIDINNAKQEVNQNITNTENRVNQTITNTKNELNQNIQDTKEEITVIIGGTLEQAKEYTDIQTATREVAILRGTDFPATALQGQLFVNTDTNDMYRWTGSEWEPIGVTSAEMDAVNQEIENAKKEMADIETEVNKAIDEIEQDVTNAQNEINQAKQDLQQAQSDLTATQTELTNAKTELTNKANNLQAQADELKAQTQGLQGSVTSINTELDEINGQLSLTATKTEVENLVNGIEIGGTNILLNSKFDKNIEKWEKAGIPEIMFVEEDGFKCAKVECPESGTRIIQQNIYDRIKMNDHETQLYTFSGWIKVVDLVEGENAHTRFYGECNTVRSPYAHFLYTSHEDTYLRNYNNQGWKKIVLQFTLPSDFVENAPSAKFQLYLRNTTGTIFFREFKIEKGNKATAWSPAPEDIQTEVTNVTNRVTQNELNIVANAEAIATKMSQTQVETIANNAVNNLQIGGRNLLITSTAERYWRLGQSAVAYQSDYMSLTDFYPINGNEQITYTVYVPYTNEGDCYFQVGCYSETKGNLDRIIMEEANTTGKTSWTATTLPNAKFIRIAYPTSLEGKVKVEIGNKATDYTPAPEDTEAQINSVSERVTTAESTIEQHAGMIATKVEQSTYTTDKNNLQSQINTNKTAITQKADSVTLEAAKTELKTYTDATVNNLQIGGTNLLPSSYLGNGNTKDGYLGASWAGEFLNHDETMAIFKPNTKYTISYKFRLETDYLHDYNATLHRQHVGALLLYSGKGGEAQLLANGDTNEGGENLVAGSIVERVCTFTTKSYIDNPDYNYVVLYYTRRSIGATSDYVDKGTFFDIKIEEGSKQTTYSPAPEDLQSQITQNSASIAVNAEAIALKASQSELNTLTGKVNSNTSQLQVQAGQIASKVTQTEIDNAINNLQIGGRNLIKNSDFTTYFQGLGTTKEFTFAGYGSNIIPTSKMELILEPNTTYTISYDTELIELVDYATYPTQSSSIYAGFIIQDANGRYIKEAILYRNDKYELGTKFSYSGQFTTGNSENLVQPRMYVYSRPFTNGTTTVYEKIKYTNLKLEKGNKKTDWTPAPEDIETRVAKTETDIIQNANDITLRATKTEAQEYVNTAVDNLQIGSRNYVVYAYGFTGHAPYGALTVNSVQKTLTHVNEEGKDYVTIKRKNKDGSEWKPESGVYTVSGYLTVDGVIPATHPFSGHILSTYGSRIGTNTIKYDSTTGYFECTQNYVNTSGWIFHVRTTPQGVAKTIVIKNLQMEKGSKATDYKDAPEDLNAYVDTAVSTAKAEIKVTTDAISQTVSNHTSSINTLSSTVSSHTTQINQNKSDITLRATKTEMDTAIGNIGTGRNMIIRKTETAGYYIHSNQQTASTYHCISDWIAIEPSKTYTFTKIDSVKIPSDQHFRIQWYDANKTYINRTTSANNEYKYTFPANAYFCKLSYPVDSNPKMELGTKATPFCLAPEDMESRMTQAEADITVNSEAIALRATKTEAQGYANTAVNNLQIGSRNLVIYNNLKRYAGGTLYNDLKHYTIEGTKIIAKNQATSSNLIGFKIATNYETTFTVSGVTDLPSVVLYYTCYNNSDTIVKSQTYKTTTVSGGKFTLTISDVPNTATYMNIGIGHSTTANYYVSRIMFVKGNKVTDYSPAPEDSNLSGRNLLVYKDIVPFNDYTSFTKDAQTGTIVGTNFNWYFTFMDDKLEPNTAYTISNDSIVNNGTGEYANKVRIRLRNSNTETDYFLINLGSGESYTFSTPENYDVTNTLFAVYPNWGTKTSFTIKGLKVEKGVTATGYSPSPEDMNAYADSAVSTAKAEIKVTTDAITNTVSSHTTSINGLNTTVSNHTTQIANNANNITLKASKTEVQEYVSMKNNNLVVNGFGQFGDNTNFNNLTYDGATLKDGIPSFKRAGNGGFVASYYIPVDTNRKYRISAWVKASGVTDSTTQYSYIGYDCYDVDKKAIGPENVQYQSGSTTTLARELKNGDTVVYLTSVAGFKKTLTETHQKSLIFWNYKNNAGYQYPPETYSRYYYNNLWADANSFNATNNTITLSKAWANGTFPAGTSVSQGVSGNTWHYSIYSGTCPNFPTEWTLKESTISGIDTHDDNWAKFRDGTAYVRIRGTWNSPTGTLWLNSIAWTDVTEEVNAKSYVDTAKAEIKVTTDAITNTVSSHTDTLNSHNTRINQNASNITATVTSIQNLSGEDNLFRNGNFYKGNADLWTFVGTHTKSFGTEVGAGSYMKIKFTSAGNGNNRFYPDTANNYTQMANTQYTLTFMAKASSAVTLTTCTAGNSGYNPKTYSLTTAWQKFTHSYTTTEGGSVTFWINTANVDVYLTDVKLTFGNENWDRVSKAESDISANANAILARVTKEEYNSMKIGGSNLLLYTDDPKKYALTTSDHNAVSTRDTEKTLVTTLTTAKGNAYRWLSTYFFENKHYDMWDDVDSEYSFSFDAKLTGSFTSPYVWFDLRNNDGRKLEIRVELKDAVYGKWARFGGTAKVKSTITTAFTGSSLCCFAWNGSTVGSTFELKNVKLEKSSKPSDWTPAPEEYLEQIKNNSAAIEVNTEAITSKVEQTLYETDKEMLNASITDVSSELKQTVTDITATFTSSSGQNMIRNSCGYEGLNVNWTGFNTTYHQTLYDPDTDVLGVKSSYHFAPSTTSYYPYSQDIKVEIGETYTYSAMVKVVTAGSGILLYVRDIDNNKDLTNTATSKITTTTKGYQLLTYTFKATNTTTIRARVAIYANCEAYVTKMMLHKGSTVLGWSSHPEEIHNGIINMSENGIKVARKDGNGNIKGYTIMSHEEFAGYNDTDGDGTFEKIFYLNEDATVSKRLAVTNEIIMGNMKIVSLTSGWGFIPTTSGDKRLTSGVETASEE